MKPTPHRDWLTALHRAANAITATDSADLRPIRSGVDLTVQAVDAATSGDLLAALRWMAVLDAVLALSTDLGRLPGAQTGETRPAPTVPLPDTPETLAALRELWSAIHAGLRRYLDTTSHGPDAFSAAVAARSAQRLVNAGAEQ